MKVQTTKGLIEHSDLDVEDRVEWSDNARVTATIWRLKGEMVRRDVHVNVLRSPEIGVRVGQ